MDDKELVNRIIKGDHNAFAYVIKNTEGLVTQIIFRMIDHTEDRKDMVQDVYMKAFYGLKGFRFQSKLSTWIGNIAYKTCLSHLSKKKLFLPDLMPDEEEGNDDVLDYLSGRFQINHPSQANLVIDRKERQKILALELENLNPLYRTLVTLYHHEELKYEEIAEITGLPAGTVKSYLFRARKTLRENLLSKFQKEEL